MKINLSLQVLLFAFILSSCGDSNILIPDAEFRKCLLQECDKNQDGNISKSEAKSTIVIYIDGRYNIKSLEGIEYFTNLYVLEFEDQNLLTSIDLSKNKKLTKLICYRNSLTSLDLSENIKLIELICGASQIATLDLSEKSELKDLNCGNSRLTTLDISECPKLSALWCDIPTLKTVYMNTNQEENLNIFDKGNAKIEYID